MYHKHPHNVLYKSGVLIYFEACKTIEKCYTIELVNVYASLSSVALLVDNAFTFQNTSSTKCGCNLVQKCHLGNL